MIDVSLSPPLDHRDASDALEKVLIVDHGSRAAGTFANAWASQHAVTLITSRRGGRLHNDVRKIGREQAATENANSVIVLTGPRPGGDAELVQLLRQLKPQRVCFVMDCAVHFGSRRSSDRERRFLAALDSNVQTHIVRISNLAGVRPGRFVRATAPILPSTVKGCFVQTDELVHCIEQVLTDNSASPCLTLLGENRAWREELESRRSGIFRHFGRVSGSALRLCGAGYLARSGVAALKKISPRARAFSFSTITPQSESELLALCNPHNADHIAVCGYNNGVSHFGWRFPGKTVVPTCHSGNTIRIDGNTVTVDAGVTLKRCIDELRHAGKEFFVVPNFSYIGMGTVFFVPVHGSGSEVSALGDTIEWVRFYDPATDRVVEANRGDDLFDESMYRLDTGLVLLQLRLRVRERASYFVQEFELTNPTAAEIWALFDDPETSNIEIRKNKADSDTIRVAKYYTSESDDEQRMEIPRDNIGRVWDRIEENRVSASLFHWFVRTLAFHVELFLTESEFEVFWDRHHELPVSKIQLRFAKRDGMKHSPFGQNDCVSADLFMTRGKRETFLDFVREFLPGVKFNPGKQSM